MFFMLFVIVVFFVGIFKNIKNFHLLINSLKIQTFNKTLIDMTSFFPLIQFLFHLFSIKFGSHSEYEFFLVISNKLSSSIF